MPQRTTKQCYFCKNGIDQLDYKDVRVLAKFTNPYAKIDPRKRSGNCARHQRMVSTAIKRARQVALLPFTTR